MPQETKPFMPEEIAQPQVGSETPNNNPPQVGDNAPQTPQVGDTPSLTLEQALDALKKTRAEAAAHRTENNTLKAKMTEYERAQLTKEEQLTAKVADLEREKAELTRQHQERTIHYEVQSHAAKLGIVDPEAAVKLLDWSQLEYDDDGMPKNAQKLLQELVKAKPYLASAYSGSPANPPRSNPNQTFTNSQIARMSPEDYAKNKAEIMRAQKEGRVIQG